MRKQFEFFLALLFVVTIAGSIWWYVSQPRTLKSLTPTQIVTSSRAGDYQTALQEYQKILQDPSKNAEEKALAGFNAYGLQYQLSGNTDDLVADMHTMKAVISDPSITLWTRVTTLNALISLSSHNSISRVQEALFDGTPYSGFYEPGNPSLSERHLYEWSYSLMPTSLAAIRIADTHTQDSVSNASSTNSTPLAEHFLNLAEDAAQKEKVDDKDFVTSTRFLVYEWLRARVIARLGITSGEPYKTQYHVAYEDFLRSSALPQNARIAYATPFARLEYAGFLLTDNDTESAKAQLDHIAEDIQTMSKQSSKVFTDYLKGNGQSADVQRAVQVSSSFASIVSSARSSQ